VKETEAKAMEQANEIAEQTKKLIKRIENSDATLQQALDGVFAPRLADVHAFDQRLDGVLAFLHALRSAIHAPVNDNCYQSYITLKTAIAQNDARMQHFHQAILQLQAKGEEVLKSHKEAQAKSQRGSS
jgi:hypothetical protein